MTVMAKRRKNNTRQSSYGTTSIKRHTIDHWESFEVKKEELDLLENGKQSDKFLEFGIATTSIFVSFLIAWFSVDFENQQKLYSLYLTIWIITLLASVILIILWLCNRNRIKSIFDEIRNRPLAE